MSEKTNEEKAVDALKEFGEALVKMAEACGRATIQLGVLVEKAKKERDG